MERLFGKKVRDKLKEYVRENDKADTYGKNRPISELYRTRYPASKA